MSPKFLVNVILCARPPDAIISFTRKQYLNAVILLQEIERKSKRSSLASTYYKISVSFKFCKLSNGDKLEITNLYALCVSCHSLPNILKNIQTCARRKAVNSKKELG